MTHSDDKGLVLPPKIAPIHFVITTIYKNQDDKLNIDKRAKEIKDQLEISGYICEIDNGDERPGEKFYKWEKKGVPVRIELGVKDIENNQVVFARRDNGEKEFVKSEDIQSRSQEILEEIQNSLFDKANLMLKEKTVTSDSWDDFKKQIKSGNYVLAHWSGNEDVEKQIKEETGATIRCIPFDSKDEVGVCIKSGKPSGRRVLFSKAY